jgi:hypothetical protein
MAGSTIYAVKSKLLTLLKANSTLSTIQCSYGDPGEAMRRESIFLGEVISDSHTAESLSAGRRRRIETYTVNVEVFVQSKAAGQQECEQRAIVLANAVEDVLADYPTLDDAVSGLMFVECSGMSMSAAEAGIDGPRTNVTVQVTAKARLA